MRLIVKHHHAAALALVGWALIFPPMLADQVDIGAPVNEWTVGARGFATVAECEKYRAHAHYECVGYVNLTAPSPTEQAKMKAQAEMKDCAQRRSEASRCTPDDDPRLKGQ